MDMLGTILGFALGTGMALVTTAYVYYSTRAELISEGNWV